MSVAHASAQASLQTVQVRLNMPMIRNVRIHNNREQIHFSHLIYLKFFSAIVYLIP